MATTVKIYRSTETGAPALSGQAGKLLDVLSGCLVDGYGGGTATSVTRSGSTATLTFTAHTFSAGDVVTVAGASQSEYNGDFVISNVTANTFDYTVTGAPATPATGTITFEKTAAGWTKPYTGTNKAVYRAGGGSQSYFRFDDTAAQYPRWLGYVAMSDVDTGTGPFPTSTQFSGGIYLAKSSTADSTARPWTVIANDRFVHVLVDCNGSQTQNNYWFFGDIVSYAPGDVYNAIVAGSNSGSTGASYGTSLATGITTASTTHYMAASFSGIGGSVQIGKHTDYVKTAGVSDIGRTGGTTPPVYPNPVDGGLWLAPIWIHEPTPRVVRGHIPGLWASCHSGRPLGHGDTFQGSGALSGRSFIALNVYRVTTTDDAQVILETSSTWYS